MTAVGDSFGIQEPQQQPDQPAGSEGDPQLDLPMQGDQQQQGEQGAQEGEQKPETGSDRHTGQRGSEKEQLFPEKPKKGPRGELLDKNGNIIATTRREKQLAYNLNRAQYAANQANRDARRMQQALQGFQALDAQIRQNNLTPQMVHEAVQLRAMAERDPIMAVRDIVARVLATGVTMEQLFGNDAVPSINARVITNELDRRLGPLEQQTKQHQQAQRINEQATELMEQFVQSHPYAETHGNEISGLVAQHGLSPERAYFELRSWVERRGFDFSMPLRPQVEAAMQRQRNGRQRSTPGSMRGITPNSVPTQNGSGSRGDFKSNTPWRDIASAVFTELNNK
jgi:hypothetical protein